MELDKTTELGMTTKLDMIASLAWKQSLASLRNSRNSDAKLLHRERNVYSIGLGEDG